eukprot:scaffold1149_cov236-Pinguiococcus_pyrenoidosus.AAC.5
MRVLPRPSSPISRHLPLKLLPKPPETSRSCPQFYLQKLQAVVALGQVPLARHRHEARALPARRPDSPHPRRQVRGRVHQPTLQHVGQA